MIEVLNIINNLKAKYPKEDLKEIIKYYENVVNESNSLETEQVTSLYNILSILQTNPNYVIESIIDGGRKV